MKTAFSTALGTKTSIDNVRVTVVLEDGTRGIGEVPTSFSFPDETIYTIRRVLREAGDDLAGSRADTYAEKIESFRGRFPRARMTISGLEVALFRAYLASRGKSEFAYWGGSKPSLESDITVPFSSDGPSIRKWLSDAVASGFTTFKCKVSGNVSEDAKFVLLVESALKDLLEKFHLRLDGNQGYTRASILEFTDKMEKMGIAVELFEQPLPKEDLEGLAYVRRRIPMPLILDESVPSVTSLWRALDCGACSGVNIKVAKSGISESRRIMEVARCEGLRLMVGCMMETMTGLSAAVYLACGTAAFDFIDLDSIYFLHHKKRYGDIGVEATGFRIEQYRNSRDGKTN